MRPPISAPSRPAMRKLGSARLRLRPSLEAVFAAGAAVLLAGAGSAAIAKEWPLRPFAIVDDAIPASLTGASGDPARGRAVVLDRRLGACLLCHIGPFPEEKF